MANSKINFGIDAPGVIGWLSAGSIFGFALSRIPGGITLGPVLFETAGFFWMGVSCGFTAILMLNYSLSGKYRHRDRMVKLLNLRGDEHVLDVGTGRGLLLIGAAKQLKTGRATGIDIWSQEDLSQNLPEKTLENARLEGVDDLVGVFYADARKMPFADGTFDAILSLACLHNIGERAGRDEACREILRVLRPGGVALISDFKNLKAYREAFENAGASVRKEPSSWVTTFPPMGILRVEKAAV